MRTAALLACSLVVWSPGFAQAPPRDQPSRRAQPTAAEVQLQERIAAEGLTILLAQRLATLQEMRGAMTEAEATLLDALKRFPVDPQAAVALAAFYARQGKWDRVTEVLEEQARLTPADRTAHVRVGAYYADLAKQGTSLTDDQKRDLVTKGLAAAERALAVDPDYAHAVGLKSQLLRHKAQLEPDPTTQQSLLDEAEALNARSAELYRQKPPQFSVPTALQSPMSAAPPCTPGMPRAGTASGQAPLRVGGNIRPPAKISDVRPVYPADLQQARVQGVVIIEAVIDETGRVADACVLRSIPGLDEAAIDAVRQWEFTPTLLNGAPVPVIMTVTVNFTLQ